MQYPVNLSLADRSCCVIGGGQVAERKAKDLLAAGACLTVISPALTPSLAAMAADGRFSYIARPFHAGDAQGFFIIICAAGDPEVNRQAAREARTAGVLVNAADDPELCDFTVPARICRGDLLITISTNGRSPALARRIREELSVRYGPEYGACLDLLGRVRAEVQQMLPDARQRTLFWRDILDQRLLDLLREGRIAAAEEAIRNAICSVGTKS